jgi:signal peptidase I
VSSGRFRWALDALETFAVAAILALVVRTYFIGSFIVVGDSMRPALRDGERVFIWRAAYLLGEPERGDVIVFRYPLDPTRDFVKRVVGLPGEEIEIRAGRVIINGFLYTEPPTVEPDRSSYPATRVPEDSVFVLGDNRRVSEDSRFFGPVPLAEVKGEVFLIYWPPGQIGLLGAAEGGP